ncbi:hypothetical protein SVAN01_00554 [Stagonosporopsis vannaccii]|nr:hypothetical protein SVAN01_00554 [Stagonosporopsis vannaccii]
MASHVACARRLELNGFASAATIQRPRACSSLPTCITLTTALPPPLSPMSVRGQKVCAPSDHHTATGAAGAELGDQRWCSAHARSADDKKPVSCMKKMEASMGEGGGVCVCVCPGRAGEDRPTYPISVCALGSKDS